MNIFRKKNKIYILSGMFAVISLIAAFKLISTLMDYRKSNNEYKELENEYVTINTSSITQTEENGVSVIGNNNAKDEEIIIEGSNNQNDNSSIQPIPWYDVVTVNFDGLNKSNPDIVGWIYYENEDISYPIMHAADNDKYLRRTFDGKSAIAGSIFLDSNNNDDFSDFHSIIYGHNMRNLSMFGKLKYYIRKDNYYDNHKYFQIVTPNVKYRCKVFSVYTVKPDDWTYSVKRLEDNNADNLINELQSNTKITNDINVTDKDKIITLSTCRDDNRLIVNAVVVAEYNY